MFPVARNGSGTVADGKLSADEQRLAAATRRAVEAAGGLKVCEHETRLSDTQICRCCSPTLRDSISIRDAVRIDAIGHGAAGHPYILNAMASIVGAVVIMLPEPGGSASGLQMSVIDLTSELGDVSRAIAEAFAGSSAGGAEITPREADTALDQVADLERATAKLRHQLEQIASGTDLKTGPP